MRTVFELSLTTLKPIDSILIILAAAIVVSIAGASSRADEPTAEWDSTHLRVIPGDGCVDQKVLASRLQARIAAPEVIRTTTIVVVEDALSERFISLEVRNKGAVVSTRRFNRVSSPCEDIADAVALAIALALEPTSQGEPAAKPQAISEVAKPKRDQPKERPWSVFMATNMMPWLSSTDTAFSLELGGTVEFHDHFRAGISAARSSTVTLELPPGQADLALNIVKVEVCNLFGSSTISPMLCAAGLITHVSAQGRGYTETRRTGTIWMPLSVRAGVTAKLSPRWSVYAAVELLGSVRRSCFDASDANRTTTTTRCFPYATAAFGLGISTAAF